MRRKMRKGCKVRFVNEQAHAEEPRYYPPVGTVGIVVGDDGFGCNVQWPCGSTSQDDVWYAANSEIEILPEDEEVASDV